jgi:hypothetical protein
MHPVVLQLWIGEGWGQIGGPKARGLTSFVLSDEPCSGLAVMPVKASALLVLAPLVVQAFVAPGTRLEGDTGAPPPTDP